MKLCANWQESSSVKGLEGNPKFQARNSKQVKSFKIPMFQTRPSCTWNLGFVSDFEIRISKSETNPKFQVQEGLVWNIGILKLFTCLEFRAWNLGFPSSPLTEELSCQFAHNFIDERLRGME